MKKEGFHRDLKRQKRKEKEKLKFLFLYLIFGASTMLIPQVYLVCTIGSSSFNEHN